MTFLFFLQNPIANRYQNKVKCKKAIGTNFQIIFFFFFAYHLFARPSCDTDVESVRVWLKLYTIIFDRPRALF